MADTIVEIDCATGEQTEREMTPAEQAQRDQDMAAAHDAQMAQQWDEIFQTRGAQLSQTDWVVEPWPSDTPDEVTNQVRDHEQEWLDFRQALRDITLQGTDDPTAIVWPTLPPAPLVTITPPPAFVVQPPPQPARGAP